MTKLADLFEASGRPIPLGHKLGSGGEGDVYEVPAISHDLVAKIYHEPLKQDKQEKLRAMVQGCDDYLKTIAAWPTTTLHLGRNGPVRGFLMPKVIGYEPIHKLYSPAHRKQLFPKADWAFLVNTARNVAAAFDAIHAHGHVIGDVNQGNAVVASNSVVKLIDCDSFQIAANGKLYLCEVGVQHFTPPELQSLGSFHGARRTVNHDNFGLAVLCFHLLFMGRHPFSGVYSGREDMPIEKAIESFRFAFGKNASSKGMSPPPNSVMMTIAPPQIATLFERAFSESGAPQDGRPKAREWVGMLDYLKHNLRTCGQEPAHKYFGGLASCPWCALERQSGVLFFIGIITTPTGQATFNLAIVWQRIMSVSPPGEASSIDPGQFTATPKPLPKEIQIARITAKTVAIVKKVSAVGILLGTLVVYPGAFIIGLIIALILFFSDSEDDSLERERKTRQTVLSEAQYKWNEAEQRWRRESGNDRFKEKLQELVRSKGQYENLDAEFAQEKQKLQATIRERQLHKFLDNFFIDDHKIPQIGPGRKATLASFGIETAADIDPLKIQRIKGFGKSYTNELMRWRTSLERKFVFDPAKGLDPSDIAALNQKFRQRRAQIESALLAGPEKLNQERVDIIRKRQSLQVEVEAAARALAQARSDMSVFR
jgi:DNA-binding helix-hairpin-helix protein with protein kinase domain